MSTEANKKIVEKFDDAMSRTDGEAALALLAPDATWWLPGDQPGGEIRTKAEMAQIFATFTDIYRQRPSFERVSLTAEGDRVALEKAGRGGVTHGGALYGNDYFMLFRIRGGLIAEVREYYDPRKVEPIVAEMQGNAG